MHTVAIFGAGLIGGSFALALRKAGFAGSIVGAGSAESLRRALELKVIDCAAPPEEAAKSADLIYVALPVQQIVEILPQLEPWAGPDCLITDAGSTKSTVVARARATFTRSQFLGGHPMAGKERRGVDAADAALFEGRNYVVTPESGAELETPGAADFLKWIRAIGARPVMVRPEEHDRLAAFSSHLPQLASTALAAVLNEKEQGIFQLAGPGLTDATRLALSPFEIWRDILATNGEAVREALETYIRTLSELHRLVGSEEMAGPFGQAGNFARSLRRQ